MTKDICYVVRLEQNEKEYWFGKSDDDQYFASIHFGNAVRFDNEDNIKKALKAYYNEYSMQENDRTFVCKVSVKDCTCFVKKDVDILLRKRVD